MRTVDLFAGAGGFSAGASRAGASIIWAANHCPIAVNVHASQHPEAIHKCQDLNQADFSALPDHDLLLASPACPGHSNAGRAARGRWGLEFDHHDSSRSTAWAVVSAAEAKAPEWLLVENVPQMAKWALFQPWCDSLRILGYELELFTLDAADFGTPQNRKRMFVAGRRGAAPRLAEQLPSPVRGQQSRSDWVPMSSILSIEEGDDWAPVNSKSKSVQNRVARGRANCGEVFLTQHVTNHPGRDLSRPLPTITTGNQMALVRGDEMRPLLVSEYLAGQGFEPGYLDGVELTKRKACRLIGNAVAVQSAEALVRKIIAA